MIVEEVELPAKIFTQNTVYELQPHYIDIIIKTYSRLYPSLRARIEKIFDSTDALSRYSPAQDEADDHNDSDYSGEGNAKREIVWQLIKKRRGQSAFRKNLMRRYGKQCMVTGSDVAAVLEAAHIDPYLIQAHNHAGNGLLLRTDIHTLFDLDLLGIEPGSLRVELHPDISAEYRSVVSKKLRIHTNSRTPLHDPLIRRYKLFQERLSSPA
jgi:hypothetical protein